MSIIGRLTRTMLLHGQYVREVPLKTLSHTPAIENISLLLK